MVGPVQILIVLLVIVVLFGGSRLASLGRGSGRQLRKTKDGLVDAGKGFKDELTGTGETADAERDRDAQ